MNYATIRPSIKSGDLLAWTHRSWKTWTDIKIQLVRFFTQSEYSHVALALELGGRIFVIEAVKPCVRIALLSQLGEFYIVPLNADWTEDVTEYALSHIGEPYSEVQAVQSFFKHLQHDSEWECAELVADILVKVGINLGDKQTPTAVMREAQLQFGSCTLVSNPTLSTVKLS